MPKKTNIQPKNGKKALIIDNDKKRRDTLEKQLCAKGFHVILAFGAKEGLESMVHAPDVIFLDLFLPNMNSFDFLGFKHIHDHYRHIPVIFTSELESLSDLQATFGPSVMHFFRWEQDNMNDLIKQADTISAAYQDIKPQTMPAPTDQSDHNASSPFALFEPPTPVRTNRHFKKRIDGIR
jgi:CheY-like chemotaxis protein